MARVSTRGERGVAVVGLGLRIVARLRAENQRLRARQISPAELERLRADHAALPRLRAELEAARRQLK